MIVKFSTGNFLSFKEITSISLAAATITEFPENVFQTPITDLDLLKSLVIYGPNSSGKSNMYKAMRFARWFILNSSKDLQAMEKIDVTNFKFNTQTVNEPSFFEFEIIVGDTKYRYGFKVDRNFVHEERLYYVKKTKEYPLFVRTGKEIIIEEKFDIAPQIKSLIRDNALLLSVAAQFNGKIATQIIKKMKSLKFLSGNQDESNISQTAKMLESPKYSKILKDFILHAGLGFSDIKSEKVKWSDKDYRKLNIPKEFIAHFERTETFNVSTTHQVFDETNKPIDTIHFDLLQNESLGTQKFISLAGPIIDAILTGGILIVDEFSSRMNPILCEAIIRLFNSKGNNPNNAQFIFVTHNTVFINSNSQIFRRDQMITFKKDEYGATYVRSLYDMRVRKDASFEKKYLEDISEVAPRIDISHHQLSLFAGKDLD